MFEKYRTRSPWILHYNAGSCNGCDVEILATLTPRYDLERFGVLNTGNPKQSDVLLVTGPVTMRSRERLVEIWSQMPEPKVVVAVGACACTGGIFRNMYNAAKGIDEYIPVDVFIPGCACHPKQILDGVVKALEILASKNKEIEMPRRLRGTLVEEDGQINRREMAGHVPHAHPEPAPTEEKAEAAVAV